MSRVSPAVGTAGMRCSCTACPLLCDDVTLAAADAGNACDRGRTAFAAALREAARGRSDDVRPACDPTIDLAARAIVAGRRILVTGLADASLETVVAACDLAEAVGAAVDAGDVDLAAVAGPTLARAGRVTADWEELRDRADLVIFWGCDPAASHPRFIERFVDPPVAGGRPRRTIAVGPAPVMPAAERHRHLPLDHDRTVEAARCLQLVLGGGELPPSVEPPLAAVCQAIANSIHAASCVAFVTAARDDVGLAAWSVVRLVRVIAHRVPAFEVPLAATGIGFASAAAVCTWRYGAAGGIAHADRLGSRFLPGEATAARLISRGEVDVVVAVGRLTTDVESAIAATDPRLTVVRIAAASAVPPTAGRPLWLRCADPLLTAGTMLRGDGRRVAIVPPQASPLPAARDLIVLVRQAVSAARPPVTGGHA